MPNLAENPPLTVGQGPCKATARPGAPKLCHEEEEDKEVHFHLATKRCIWQQMQQMQQMQRDSSGTIPSFLVFFGQDQASQGGGLPLQDPV